MIIQLDEKKVKTSKYETHFNYTCKFYSDGESQFTFFDEPQIIGRNGGKKPMSESKTNISEEQRELYRYQARIRAGSTVRQLVKENNLKYMWTLTYSDEVTSREIALDDFKKFIMRLNYQTGDKVPYVAVTEVQKARLKRTGAPVIHFHMAIDKYIDIKLLHKTWKHGYVFVSTYDDGKKISGDKNNIASYLSKYLKKDMEDNPEIVGKKMYLNSKGLKRPNSQYGVMTDEEKESIKKLAHNYEIVEGITGANINIKEIMHEISRKMESEIMAEAVL